MAIDSGAYYYLFDPAFQIENNNGKPVVGGHVEVYEAGTDNKVITCQDWDGTVNPFKIPLKSDGRAVILVDIGKRYDAYAYDSFNNLVFSRLNILPLTTGNVSVKGLSKVFHDSTLSGDGTAISPLKVIGGGGGGLSTVITEWPVVGNGSSADPVTINDMTLLANDDTLISYTATVEGKDALVLGVNGNWFSSATSGFQSKSDMSNYVTNNTLLTQVGNLNRAISNEATARSNADTALDNKIANKYDTSAFYEVSGTFLTEHQDISMKLDTSAFNSTISAYALSADVYNKTEVDEKLANFGGFEVVEGDSEGKPIVADPSTKIIYLVQATTGKPDNYKEWIYDTDWRMIGDTTIDLTDYAKKSDIPSLQGYATENYVNSAVSGKLDTSAFDNTITAYALKTDIPVVPTNVGAFTNDVGYLSAHQDISMKLDTSAFNKEITAYALKSELPVVPTNVGAFTNDVGYLTEHQSLTAYATNEYVSGNYALKSEIPTIPTNVSYFTNDAGYLTAHQSLADYALKSELPVIGTIEV